MSQALSELTTIHVGGKPERIHVANSRDELISIAKDVWARTWARTLDPLRCKMNLVVSMYPAYRPTRLRPIVAELFQPLAILPQQPWQGSRLDLRQLI